MFVMLASCHRVEFFNLGGQYIGYCEASEQWQETIYGKNIKYLDQNDIESCYTHLDCLLNGRQAGTVSLNVPTGYGVIFVPLGSNNEIPRDANASHQVYAIIDRNGVPV